MPVEWVFAARSHNGYVLIVSIAVVCTCVNCIAEFRFASSLSSCYSLLSLWAPTQNSFSSSLKSGFCPFFLLISIIYFSYKCSYCLYMSSPCKNTHTKCAIKTWNTARLALHCNEYDYITVGLIQLTHFLWAIRRCRHSVLFLSFVHNSQLQSHFFYLFIPLLPSVDYIRL